MLLTVDRAVEVLAALLVVQAPRLAVLVILLLFLQAKETMVGPALTTQAMGQAEAAVVALAQWVEMQTLQDKMAEMAEMEQHHQFLDRP
jgi:hypothetical protein